MIQNLLAVAVLAGGIAAEIQECLLAIEVVVQMQLANALALLEIEMQQLLGNAGIQSIQLAQ